ncbi:DUF5797 family protein [Natronorubrum sp. FCH18a]|uniref:DUF5797 family protein n=1 Tax=Natronorubrum sp. FCH18a TaxID=3447018 RepID=UPI003F51481A
MPNPYEVLGITKNANEVVVEAAYRALVKEHHPDHGGSQERFQEIRDAYKQIQNGDPTAGTTDGASTFSGFARGLVALGTPVSETSIESTLADDLTIEKDPLRVSLVGLFRTDIEPLAWPHEVDSIQTEDRFLCVTRVENTSEYVQKWNGLSKTKFVGSDGQTYSPTHDLASTETDIPPIVDQRDTQLSPQFSTNYSKLEPKSWTLGITVAPNLPGEVDIQQVSYTHSVFEGHQTDGIVKEKIRYEFSITPERQQQMLSLIAQELMDEVPEETPLQALTPVEDTSASTQIMEGNSQSTQDGPESQQASTPMTDDSGSVSAGSSARHGFSEQDRERVADIVRLAPTSNGELASSWGLETGKEAWEYLSQHLDDYYYRNKNSRIEPTEEAVQIVK